MVSTARENDRRGIVVVLVGNGPKPGVSESQLPTLSIDPRVKATTIMERMATAEAVVPYSLLPRDSRWVGESHILRKVRDRILPEDALQGGLEFDISSASGLVVLRRQNLVLHHITNGALPVNGNGKYSENGFLNGSASYATNGKSNELNNGASPLSNGSQVKDQWVYLSARDVAVTVQLSRVEDGPFDDQKVSVRTDGKNNMIDRYTWELMKLVAGVSSQSLTTNEGVTFMDIAPEQDKDLYRVGRQAASLLRSHLISSENDAEYVEQSRQSIERAALARVLRQASSTTAQLVTP